MNRWILRAPSWALALAAGFPMAVLLTILLHFDRSFDWASAMVEGVAFGAVAGAGLAVLLRRQLDRQRAAVGDVPDDIRDRVASRGTLLGPVPEDPQIRSATSNLIDHQLAEMRRRRPRAVVTNSLLLAALTWFALTRSPWWWVGVAVVAGLFLVVLLVPGRLRRRAALLRQE